MRTALAAALLLVVCAAAPAVLGTPEPEEFGLMVAAPGASETFYACTPCHSERIVVQQGLTREQWDEALDLMVEEHEMEPIEGDARTVILDYLAEHYGPDRPNFPR
ncbi:MAG: aldehyde dehydrogenase [Alphaproteobacteria bacterium]|nr:aldehyde dehydrogenase [Alphaproteobacteria bacterium]